MLGKHRMLVGPRRSTAELRRLCTVVKITQTERQSRVLARLDGPVPDPAWAVSEAGLEDIILAYMSEDEAVAAGPLSLAGGMREVDERGQAALDAAAEVLAVDASRIATAVSYYGDYRDEIDTEISDADEASARAEEAWRVQQRLIT